MDHREQERRRRRRAVAMAALLIAGLVPSAAGAATVSFDSPSDLVRPTFDFSAAPGEANRVRVRLTGSDYGIRDSGAPVTIAPSMQPGEPPSCRRSGTEVLCEGARADQNPGVIRLGDRHDRATVGVISGLSVFGGDGNDVIVVPRGAAEAFPDAGDPHGGNGLLGGRGDDRLYGSARNDSLVGGEGNDILDGGGGRNDFAGGAGRDTIYARNGRRETVRCGAGRDTVYADRPDRLVGCERVHR